MLEFIFQWYIPFFWEDLTCDRDIRNTRTKSYNTFLYLSHNSIFYTAHQFLLQDKITFISHKTDLAFKLAAFIGYKYLQENHCTFEQLCIHFTKTIL